MQTSTTKTKDMMLTALFAVLISVCAWISIPAAVPFTMQTFGVFLSAGVLGGKRGTFAVVIYLLLGAAGLPVYAGGTSGIGILFGSTGGYMFSWIFTGLILRAVQTAFGKKTWTAAVSMVLGLITCYTLGTAWFVTVYAQSAGHIGVWTALSMCVIPFVIPDLVKLTLALMLRKRLARFV